MDGCIFVRKIRYINSRTTSPIALSKLASKMKQISNNQPLFRTVEHFAKRWNLAKWQNEFLDAYKIMATNKNTGLAPITADFNSHGCKYKSYFGFSYNELYVPRLLLHQSGL